MHDAPAHGDATPHSAADYDALPYPSFPYTYLQPARLSALAILYGLQPAPVATARVLELGCASGGNLIPLAARHPHARFLGVDLSARQIEAGRQRIADLGLRNIALRQADLSTLAVAPASYDIVLCHGVFSWVPPAVQDAILRICASSLVRGGLAAISYNVLPGWHLRSVVRDICLEYAGEDGAPQVRAERARAALLAIADAQDVDDDSVYPQVLRNEAKRLGSMPTAYIMGEFLAPDNYAFTFTDFAARARAHGLGYLCEATVASSHAQFMLPDASARITALADGNALALQRHLDIFSGRRFRRSVLVNDAQVMPGAATFDLARMRRLHFSSPLLIAPHAAADTPQVFVDSKGRTLTVPDAAVAAAFAHLARVYPDNASMAELLTAAAVPATANTVEKRVARALIRLVGSGRAALSSVPERFGHATDSHPCAWPLARLEARRLQPWMTGQNHVAVPPNALARALLPHLDGSHDHAWIDTFVASLPAQFDGAPSAQSAVAMRAAALQFLARHALLQA